MISLTVASVFVARSDLVRTSHPQSGTRATNASRPAKGCQPKCRGRRLPITADSGGPGGARPRLWKTELATFAAETGLKITALPCPREPKWKPDRTQAVQPHLDELAGASPLTCHEVIIETIAATTTKTGLTVRAVLDTGSYPKCIKISDKDMKVFEAEAGHRHFQGP